MPTRGLSDTALRAAARDLCHQATRVLADGDGRRADLLVEEAASLVRRRRGSRPVAAAAPVIVVDDDADIRASVAAALRDEGYRVLCFSNGQEALDHLKIHPAASLILIDLRMPIMDGWTFHEKAAEDGLLASIPMIALSASCRPPPGTVPLLEKPLRLEELLEAVSETVSDNARIGSEGPSS